MSICFNIFYFFVGVNATWRGIQPEPQKHKDTSSDCDPKEEAPEVESDDQGQGHGSDQDTGSESTTEEDVRNTKPRPPKPKLARKAKPSQEMPKRARREKSFPSENQINAVLYKGTQSQRKSCDVAEESICTSNADGEGYQDEGGSEEGEGRIEELDGQLDSQLSEPGQLKMQRMLTKTSSHLPPVGMRGEKKTQRETNRRLAENKKIQEMWDDGIRPEDVENKKKERSSTRPPKRASSQACEDNISNYNAFGFMIDREKGCIFCTRYIFLPLANKFLMSPPPPSSFSPRMGENGKLV